jgi:ribosomal protein S18 acetylase RimI-like enzyme
MFIRRASIKDGIKIIELYDQIYQGSYPDPCMLEYQSFKDFIKKPNHFWFVADNEGDVVGSLVMNYDPEHLLGKAYGAAVKADFQGHGILTKMMEHGLNYLKDMTPGLEVVYATNRSVNEVAQSLVEKFGFKKLGIFPNTHKSLEYETHTLAALLTPQALKKRFTHYKMHEEFKALYEIIKTEIPELEDPIEFIDPEPSSRLLRIAPTLEIINSYHFVNYRHDLLTKNGALEFDFFPFHEPNIMISSPDQSIEIFCHLSGDGHCVIIGGKVAENIHYTDLMKRTCLLLRDYGARYIEIILRADKPKILNSIIASKMIPSAFFRAFQLKDGKRYDFVVLSRSYEIFDFQNIRLKGKNQLFLEEYYKAWKKISLNPKLLDI